MYDISFSRTSQSQNYCPLVWQGTALASLSHVYCVSPYIVVSLTSLLIYSIYIIIPFYTSVSPFSIPLTPGTINSTILTRISYLIFL